MLNIFSDPNFIFESPNHMSYAISILISSILFPQATNTVTVRNVGMPTAPSTKVNSYTVKSTVSGLTFGVTDPPMTATS